MKSEKILIKVNKLSEIKAYQKIGIANFLFGLKGYSIEDPVFILQEIKSVQGNIYLDLNKMLDTKGIEAFKILIKDLSFVKGIFFDDLGLYQVLKDTNIPLIWHQSHFVLNSLSINWWLKRVKSVCLSNELTKDEITVILNQCSKPIVLNVLGRNQAMYSRRYLLSSFSRAKGLKTMKKARLATNNGHQFLAKETIDGTTLYYYNYFNYLPLTKSINDDKIMLYYINSTGLTPKKAINLINGGKMVSNEDFLNHRTIYKLED